MKKKIIILFVSAGLVFLIAIASVFFYIIIPKLEKQAKEGGLPSFLENFRKTGGQNVPIPPVAYPQISNTIAIIKGIDLDKKEIIAEVAIPQFLAEQSPPFPSPKPEEIIYKEFILKITEETTLKGMKSWSDIKPGQKTTIKFSGNIFDPNNNFLILKEITVYSL